MADKANTINTSSRISFGFFWWLGGATYVAHQPGYNFWDGLIWLYYVGAYIGKHFTLLSS